MGEELRVRPPMPFHVAEVRVDPARLRVAGPKGSLRLEPRVMDVLVALAARAPRPVSREELIDAVWGGAAVTDGVLTRCISILRDSLGDDRGEPRFIETLSKKGYRLLPPVAYFDGAASARMPPEAVAHAVAAKPVSIAVLPFVNLAGDEADEHLADGLTELMIANLAGVASLRVIARTSSMVYKHACRRVRDIAAKLGVDYVVEGSVRRDGGRMQVVAQLIEARSEAHAWAHTYTRELRDLLTLLNEIARAVTKAVSAHVMPVEAARLARPVPIGEAALQHYLKGRFFLARRGPEALGQAGVEFAACTREAPDFAPAHGGLADCEIMLAVYGIGTPLQAAARAREHHARALALDPEGAEVQTAHGGIGLFFDWNVDEAERAFVRALAVNPSYTTAYLAYGDLLMMRGEFERGLTLIREAVKLSPFDLGLNMNVGDFLIFARRFDEAVRQLEHTLAMDERFLPGRLRLAEALALGGRRDEAIAQAERAFAQAQGQPRVRETRAFAWAAGGRRDEAKRELAALAAERGGRYVSAWELARAHAVIGRRRRGVRLAARRNRRARPDDAVHRCVRRVRSGARRSAVRRRAAPDRPPGGTARPHRTGTRRQAAHVGSCSSIASARDEVARFVRRREIAIKKAIGRLSAPDDLEAAGFTKRSITFAGAQRVGTLPPIHADPFDRMLVAQALEDGVPIVSRDPRIARYPVQITW